MFNFVMVNNVTFKSAIIVSVISFFSLFTPAFAVDSTTSAKPPLLIKRVETRVENLDKRVGTKEAKINERIKKIEDIREKIASHEAIFKEKLAQFKDRKKAGIAERINNELNKINLKRTEEMQKHLDKMSTILDKLEAKTNTKQDDVRTVIASTSAAVQAQAQKDYTINVTSETHVKLDVQKVRQQLANDLFVLRKSVIDAKQSLSNAIMKAKSGQNRIKEGTPSGQQ